MRVCLAPVASEARGGAIASVNGLGGPVGQLLTEYADVFKEMETLPPERDVAHSIPLQEGHTPPNKRMYRLSPREQAEVEVQVKKLLDMRLIQPSTSPYGALGARGGAARAARGAGACVWGV